MLKSNKVLLLKYLFSNMHTSLLQEKEKKKRGKELGVFSCCMFSIPVETSLTLILSLTNPLRMLINFRDTILIFGKCQPFKSKHLQRAHFQHSGWSFSTSDFSVYSHNGEIKSTEKYLLLESYSNISARMSVRYFTIQILFAH